MADVRLIDANAVASGVEYAVEKIEREGVDTKGVSDPFTAKMDAWALKLAAKILRDETVSHTIDAVPVVHGRWKEHYFSHRVDTYGNPDIGMECSVCGFRWYSAQDAKNFFRYCPNCGAKMDGKEG